MTFKNIILNTIGVSLFLTLLVSMGCNSSDSSDNMGKELEAGFISPPNSAKPRVWWHWMNGNITKDGIQKDLEWMNRVNIGGFQNFDAAFMTPQIVDNRLVYMSTEWKDAFSFTTHLADSLGLEMAIAGSPGWSESGGPWVKPEEAMKKLVWSETRIEGGKPFSGKLLSPPSSTGSFQDIGSESEGFLTAGVESEPLPEYYADAAVIAFKVPETETTLIELQPVVTSSGGSFSLEMLTDGNLAESTYLPPVEIGQNAWIQYEFQQAETIHSLTLVGGIGGSRFGEDAGTGVTLEASDDGNIYRKITDIPNAAVGQITLTFDPITAKFFRVTYETKAPVADRRSALFGGGGGSSEPQAPKGTDVAEFVLHTTPRIHRVEDKAGFAMSMEIASNPTPETDPTNTISKNDIINLTSQMAPDGTLEWTPEEGKWVILRFGYSLTGSENGPASPEATGLEVDKLSAKYVRSYFTNYLDQYLDATDGLMGENGLQYIITDSYEAETQNWTDNMVADFKEHRGYDILPWLPTIAGYVVESGEASDGFLWDFRKTIGDLITENHYDQLTDILNERGMKGRYTESHEDRRVFNMDGMEVKRTAAVPMSATWTPTGNATEVQTRFKADVRESASVSHIYGQNLVAAESLTAIATAWQWSPETLKPTADMELANGLNRFVIHTSVHQPVDDKIPGIGLGPFGQWFNRHETWAGQAGAWMTYLGRSSYMLQQGKFVADIIYFYGEDNNITSLYKDEMPNIPEGYNYDFVNSDALVNVLSMNDDMITTPSGMKYKVLVLDPGNTKQMSLPVLRKIRDMVNDGAVVIGSKPVETPSLSDNSDEFATIVNELWSSGTTENEVGNGTVFSNISLDKVLDSLGILPDFQYTKPSQDTELLYVHRQLDDIDIYWVNNRNYVAKELEATFRVTGKTAEIWHPETGEVEMASYHIGDETTTVPLSLTPNDAVFVVFRNSANTDTYTIPEVNETVLETISGEWNVQFQAERGAPEEVVFGELEDWADNTDSGIKYFSGTATYTKTIQAPANWITNGDEIWLNLGNVKNIAEVKVNGQELGIVWKTPFKMNVTEALVQGENTIEIKVTNLWVNRLIGDQQPNISNKITYTTQAFYQANAPLKSSGLLGPVTISSVTKNK